MKFIHTTTSPKPRTRHGQFVQIRACIDYDLWVYFLLDYKSDRPFSKEYKSDLVFKQRYKNGECSEHVQSDFSHHCAISWTNWPFCANFRHFTQFLRHSSANFLHSHAFCANFSRRKYALPNIYAFGMSVFKTFIFDSNLICP